MDNLGLAQELVAAGEIDAADTLLRTSGVECFTAADGQEFCYLNTGETYQDTVVWKKGDRIHAFVSSWGAVYEEAEDRYCKENNAIRCGYCGEFTDMDKKNWREVVCTSCGHNVGG